MTKTMIKKSLRAYISLCLLVFSPALVENGQLLLLVDRGIWERLDELLRFGEFPAVACVGNQHADGSVPDFLGVTAGQPLIPCF